MPLALASLSPSEDELRLFFVSSLGLVVNIYLSTKKTLWIFET